MVQLFWDKQKFLLFRTNKARESERKESFDLVCVPKTPVGILFIRKRHAEGISISNMELNAIEWKFSLYYLYFMWKSAKKYSPVLQATIMPNGNFLGANKNFFSKLILIENIVGH